jgi:glycosyltransferase involved in cell wall biosynthesis
MKNAVLFVMPTDHRRSTGPVSVWITAAGWAAAARDRYGEAWLATPAGIIGPEAAEQLATQPRTAIRPTRQGWRRWVPTVVGTARKDFRQFRHARRFEPVTEAWLAESAPLSYVWQHHEMFHWSGFRVAQSHGCPLVLFVDAPIVWEARRWGVHRPLWGRAVERWGEEGQLRRADLVACVSEEVAAEVVRLGADADRVIVTPCGVDTARFHPGIDGSRVRERFGLRPRFVVGWAGTFHRFHGLDLLLDAITEVQRSHPEVALLLVGDGLDRPRIEAEVVARGLVESVVFTGAVLHSEMPEYIAAMDVAVVVDPGTGEFHYSPLKLKEYLACGRSVIAPASGQIGRAITDNADALLVPPGDARSIADAIVRVAENPDLAAALAGQGPDLVEREWTWSRQIDRIDQALGTISAR